MHQSFEVHRLNEIGLKKADDLAHHFDRLLSMIMDMNLSSSRELSLAITHLEIACMYAKKSMSMRKENQLHRLDLQALREPRQPREPRDISD